MSSPFRMRQWFAMFCAFVAWGCAATVFASEAVPDRVFERTEAAFANKEVHGDVGFLLTQGARKRGRQIVLRPRADLGQNREQPLYAMEYALWEMRNTALPRLFFQMPAPRAEGFDPARAAALVRTPGMQRNLAAQGQQVARIMMAAFACKAGSSAVEILGKPDYEYVSTHQLFATLVFAQRQCQARNEFGSLLGRYVGRVRDEFVLQLPDAVLSDLQIERAAMLCMVGRCDLVPAAFTQRVIAAQGSHGLWQLKDPLITTGALPVEHPTALAYYLLTQVPR